MLGSLTLLTCAAKANCDDGKTEGWDQANQAMLLQGCQIRSEVKACPVGSPFSWYTEYFSEPPCTAKSVPTNSTPNAWSNCDDQQQGVIISAFKEAREWLIRSDDRLQAFLRDPESPQSKAVATALRKHFGMSRAEAESGGFASAQSVLKNIERLEAKIGQPVTGTCSAANAPSPNSAPDEQRIGIASATSDSNHFTYAPIFFQRGPPAQGTTVIHEMTHSWLHFSDSSYEDQGKYPGRSGVAIENPASYGGFIRDIGTGKH